MILKICPRCLGDMAVEAIPGGADGICYMCGYRLPVEVCPSGLGRNQSLGSMVKTRREWPYPRRRLRPDRLVRAT
jgi:hypothetical protein